MKEFVEADLRIKDACFGLGIGRSRYYSEADLYMHSALDYLGPLEFEQKFYQTYCQEVA